MKYVLFIHMFIKHVPTFKNQDKTVAAPLVREDGHKTTGPPSLANFYFIFIFFYIAIYIYIYIISLN